MRQDLLKTKDKVSGLVLDKKIAHKSHGRFFTSPIDFTKPTLPKGGKGGKGVMKQGAPAIKAATPQAFKSANQSPIALLQPVKKPRQSHPGNNAHLKLEDMKYCDSCNCHVNKTDFTQHCGTGKHQKSQQTSVRYEYCNNCNNGHLLGSSCPKNTAEGDDGQSK